MKMFEKKQKPTVKAEVIEALSNRQKVELGLGATALQNIRAHSKLEVDRVKAEDDLAIKAMGGTPTTRTRDNEMGDVIIGDHSNYQEANKNGFPQLAGMALIAASVLAPAVWLGGKYLDKPAPPPVVDTDTVTALKIFRE